MKDRLLKAVTSNLQARIICASTTNLVDEGVKLHECMPTAAAAYGRMLTGGLLMGSMLKNTNDKLTLQIDGKGPAGKIVSVSSANATVKGYIQNPKANLPLNSKGKLDVGGVVGKDGRITVIKDMGLREPYIGQVPIYNGEIAEDLAYYFTVSEQIPSAVALGVLIDKDLRVKASGGLIIQMMPDYDISFADKITDKLLNMPPLTKMIDDGISLESILKYIFEDVEIKILDEIEPKYKCDCSREKAEQILASLSKEDLEDIYKDNKTEEMKCEFCNKTYKFTHNQIYDILKRK